MSTSLKNVFIWHTDSKFSEDAKGTFYTGEGRTSLIRVMRYKIRGAGSEPSLDQN